MIKLFSKPNCPQCMMTHKELKRNNIPFEYVDLTQDPEALEYVTSLGHSSAPVVVTDEGDSWSGFRPDRIRELA